MKLERETNHKRLNLRKLRIDAVERDGRDGVATGWTLGRVCAMVSVVSCVRLMIH